MRQGTDSAASRSEGITFRRGHARRLSGLAERVLWALLIGSVIIAALALAFGAWPTAWLAAGNTICHGSLLALLRRGHVTGVGMAASATLLLTAAYALIIGHGIHDVAVVLMPVLLVVGSVMLDRTPFLILVGLSVVAVLGVGLAERWGLIPGGLPGLTDATDLAATPVVLVCVGAVVYLLIDRLYGSFNQAAASERSYREIFNATNEAIFVHDSSTGAILEVNEPMLALYGYTRVEALRCSVGQLSADQTGDADEEALRRIASAVSGGPQIFEWHARKKDGSTFWAEVTLQASDIGGHGRVLAVVRDIEERKRFQDQRRQAEKLQAVGQLAGGVAHDFNNQLAGIIGFADLLRARAGSDPTVGEYTSGILTAATRAADITSQLLAFARKGRTSDAAVDLHALVLEVVALLQHSIDRRIRIRTELQASEYTTAGDASQLQNAVLNLGLNARDAMPNGGEMIFRTETLSVAGESDLKVGKHVRLEVIDTGIGMAEATRERLFEPFFTTKPAGTGLGLAAVYGTVRSHRGRIDVESTPGKGARVSLLLPVTAPDVAKAAPVSGGSARPQSRRVLLVEDEATVAEATRQMLETLGHEVTVCEDAQAGVETYQANSTSFDLVLMDLTTPRLSAREALARILEANPAAHVVLYSGYTAGAETQRLLAAGAKAFLSKPFRLEQLESTLAGEWSD